MAWYRGYAVFVIEKGKHVLVPESVRSNLGYAKQYAERLPKNCQWEICPLVMKRGKLKDGGSGVPNFLVAPEDEPCLTPWSDEP